MQAVDEAAEVVGRAEPRRGREEPRHLVAPGARVRMLADRQQLDVGEAEVARIGGQLVGQLLVAQRAVAVERVSPPGAEVHFVDRHRPGERVGAAAVLEPVLVRPLVARAEHDRRVRRRDLGGGRVGVGLEREPAVPVTNRVLVAGAHVDPRHEELPDAGAPERSHRVQAAVPAVDVADEADRGRVGRPDGEGDAGDPVHLPRVGAEPLPEALVPALADEVQVEIAERRRERVRVAHDDCLAVRAANLELVAKGQLGALDDPFEEAGLRLRRRELDRLVALRARHHPDRVGAKRPDDDAAVLRVCAERGVRVVQLDHARPPARPAQAAADPPPRPSPWPARRARRTGTHPARIRSSAVTV